jgi:hypothetical protein
MSTGIREQDGVAMIQKEFTVSDYALAVIRNSMKKNDRAAVEMRGMDVPGLQQNAIVCFYAHILKFSIVTLTNLGRHFRYVVERPAWEM